MLVFAVTDVNTALVEPLDLLGNRQPRLLVLGHGVPREKKISPSRKASGLIMMTVR